MTTPTRNAAIEVKGLVRHYGEIRAVDGVDVRVDAGEIRGLLGPNGAGKTTLLRMLFGLVQPDKGSMRLAGKRVDGRATATPGLIGGFVEFPSFYPYLSGRRNLELISDLEGGVSRDRIGEVLAMMSLSERGGQKVGEYSSGMRQRLGLAASLLRVPQVLLLDEPSIGLDPGGARDVVDLLRRLSGEGVTILLSSHNVSELEHVCDSITIMRSGTVVWDGTMDRLRAEAPAPAHRMWTSDDDRALAVVDAERTVMVTKDPRGGLTIRADKEQLDAFVIALGREGVAVQRLELAMHPIESMFFELTGPPESASGEHDTGDGGDDAGGEQR
ncbi:MAG TPA: ABC transporter ATP-binding protein [Actinomycetota bacterium]